MSVNGASGCRLFVGTTTAATTQGQFAADSYIEVGEVEDLGSFGDKAEELKFTALSDARTKKLKGARDAGTMAVVCGADDSDEGQDAMIAAEATKFDYNFKVVLNDQLTISGTPSVHYFRGKVMSKEYNVGNASNVVRQNFNVGINSAIIDVAAT